MKNKLHFSLLLIIISTSIGQVCAQAPYIDSVYPQKAPVGNLITITGNNLGNPTSVTIGTQNEVVVSSENSKLVILLMPGTAGGAVTVKQGISIGVYAIDFIITATTPPNKQIGNKIFDTYTENTTNVYEQGFAVAISADGNTAVVGADADSGIGAVRVYIRNNILWTQQGSKLVGTGAIGNSAQGYSVAISADGNTLIEGGVGDNGFTGAAWIFTRDKNGVWTQQGSKHVGSNSVISNNTTPEQGYAVSISADGNTTIIGGRRDNYYIGAAWIFTRSNNVWTEQQKIIGTGYMSYQNVQGTQVYLGVDMGTSVAMSADGNTALMGGPADNSDTGAVWVFTRTGNSWVQQGNKLVGTGATASYVGGIQQGTSTALSADGNTVIVGGPFDTDNITSNNNSNYGGAAWIFTRSGSAWSQQGNKLFATDATLGAEQGWSVGISADGNTAMVGAPTDSSYTGAAWIYTRSNNVWSQNGKKLIGTNAVGSAKQGWPSAISADGNTAIIGGPEDYYQHQGASWVFADSNAIILPVTFANLEAYVYGKGIQTTWTGYNEINLSKYNIQKSADGYNFTAIGNIAAKTNAQQNNYAWFDASPFAGNNFYRIQAISKDGSAQYSAIVKVNISNTQSSIQVYPNPTNGMFKLVTKETNKQVEVNITDVSGKKVYENIFYNTSSSYIQLHAAKGTYFLTLKTDTSFAKQKLIIQ